MSWLVVLNLIEHNLKSHMVRASFRTNKLTMGLILLIGQHKDCMLLIWILRVAMATKEWVSQRLTKLCQLLTSTLKMNGLTLVQTIVTQAQSLHLTIFKLNPALRSLFNKNPNSSKSFLTLQFMFLEFICDV